MVSVRGEIERNVAQDERVRLRKAVRDGEDRYQRRCAAHLADVAALSTELVKHRSRVAVLELELAALRIRLGINL